MCAPSTPFSALDIVNLEHFLPGLFSSVSSSWGFNNSSPCFNHTTHSVSMFPVLIVPFQRFVLDGVRTMCNMYTLWTFLFWCNSSRHGYSPGAFWKRTTHNRLFSSLWALSRTDSTTFWSCFFVSPCLSLSDFLIQVLPAFQTYSLWFLTFCWEKHVSQRHCLLFVLFLFYTP